MTRIGRNVIVTAATALVLTAGSSIATAAATGPAGPAGATGPTGATSPQGLPGQQGPTGRSGWSGQVQFTPAPTGHSIASVKIVSQDGPSILSAKVDPDNTSVILFTGKDLPTNLFPQATQVVNTKTDPQLFPGVIYSGWETDTVAHTSFAIFADWENTPETYTFNYFLPSN
jgi:hypothetical protein